MLSKKDEMILDILMQNSKLSTREISDKTKIPITTVHNRIKKLEAEGVIKKYVAITDYRKRGKNIRAFIQISVMYTTPTGKSISQEELAKKIYQMPEVESCYIMAGGTDILIHVSVKDMDELNTFVISKLRNLEGVGNTLTGIILSDISEKSKKRSGSVAL